MRQQVLPTNEGNRIESKQCLELMSLKRAVGLQWSEQVCRSFEAGQAMRPQCLRSIFSICEVKGRGGAHVGNDATLVVERIVAARRLPILSHGARAP